jgi:thiamine monophosphate kinase
LNKVGFEIKKDSIPLSSSLLDLAKKHKGIDVYEYALHFGGDYELLLTIPPDAFKKMKGKLTAIGIVTKEQDLVLVDGTSKTILENRGYEHFKDSNLF